MGAPDVAFSKQYQAQATLLSQQTVSRFEPCVQTDRNWTGEEKFYDQYASDSMVELMSRYADTPIQQPDHRRRRVTPRYFVSNTLEDPQDALQMLIDPKSIYMQAKMAAAARQRDDVLIAALGGTSYTGKTGATAVTFPAAQQVVSGSAGMTKAKILRAKRKLDAAEVEPSERYASHAAAQLEDLLLTTEVSSSDFNTVKALVQGELTTWIGFKWIHTERLLTNGSSERLCYFWQRMGMQLAVQKEVEGRVDERNDKNYAWQVYLRMAIGATRLEEARVVEVACVETS